MVETFLVPRHRNLDGSARRSVFAGCVARRLRRATMRPSRALPAKRLNNLNPSGFLWRGTSCYRAYKCL